MIRFAFLLMGLLACFLSSASQAAHIPLDFEGRPIIGISVVDGTIGADDIQRMTGLRPRTAFSARSLRRSLRTLYQTGLFEDVAIEVERAQEGVTLIFILTPKLFISKIDITGNSYATRKILAALNLKEGDEFSHPKWTQAERRLNLFYHRHGHFKARFSVESIRQGLRNTVQLRIHIQEGPRARLKEIIFVGNKKLADLLLYLTFGVAEGFYDASRIERGLQKLDQLYQQRGFLRALIGPPALDIDQDQ